MRPDERRQFQRASLRLLISRIGAAGMELPGRFWTSDLSAGGMYFRAQGRAAQSLPVGAQVSFELAVPPGGGYSPSPGTVRGQGCVVRTAPAAAGAVGLAVRFSHPLSIDFQGASS